MQLITIFLWGIKGLSVKGWLFLFRLKTRIYFIYSFTATIFFVFVRSVLIMLFFKKDLANKFPCSNFAAVLCDSLIKKGRGIWPDDALATGNAF